MEQQTNPYSALFLDDDVEACERLETFFRNENFEFTTTTNVQEFIRLSNEGRFSAIISDYNLQNISNQNGADVLKTIRANNKNAVVAILSGFVNIIMNDYSKKNELKKLDIEIFSKGNPEIAAKNIKRIVNNKIKDGSLPDLMVAEKKNMIISPNEDVDRSIHFMLNKQITLEYLDKLSNKSIDLPVYRREKTYPYAELYGEVERGTGVGSDFILQFIETLSDIRKIREELSND